MHSRAVKLQALGAQADERSATSARGGTCDVNKPLQPRQFLAERVALAITSAVALYKVKRRHD
jgi:hypothetical protein